MSAEALAVLERLQQSNNWDVDNLKSGDLDAAAQMIHLCTLRNDFNEGDEAGEPPTNHWTICLQHSPTTCVMLDMVPGYGSDGLRGKIETTSIGDKPYTDETLHAFTYKPSRNVTVADVVQIINEKGRDRFNLSPEWEGCRFWLSVVMGDFEDVEVVDKGSAMTALEALRQYWMNPEGSEPRVMREGVFRNG
ncbi:hypothetical protein MFIFM68171_08622 [Madurella fahalii]|uniref:DUF7770 domain-containing protein n=1 Tax=Madurella fahalii TaxID=1157608 RepID=A0ABQ0GKX6_9PEZI